MTRVARSATVWSLHKSFEHDGERISYDVIGAGPPLVMVHGTPFSSYVWRNIARELARSHTVYLYDLVGYGQSEKREGQDVSLGRQSELFAALLGEWGLREKGRAPDVIAHDFGGATVLRAHLLSGCDYNRLLLVDPVAVRPWGSPFVQHVRQHEAAFAGVPDYMHEAMLHAYIRGAIHRQMLDSELAPYVEPWTGPIGKPAFYRQIAQMDQRYTDEVQDRYGLLCCPVRLLWGEEDAWIPVERGEELTRLLPSCDLTTVPGSGHLMQEDAPEAIVSAAIRFFDQ